MKQWSRPKVSSISSFFSASREVPVTITMAPAYPAARHRIAASSPQTRGISRSSTTRPYRRPCSTTRCTAPLPSSTHSHRSPRLSAYRWYMRRHSWLSSATSTSLASAGSPGLPRMAARHRCSCPPPPPSGALHSGRGMRAVTRVPRPT